MESQPSHSGYAKSVGPENEPILVLTPQIVKDIPFRKGRSSEYVSYDEAGNVPISLSVAEEIKTADIPPGNKKEDDPAARYAEWAMERLSRYVKPHKVLSRIVTNEDIERVIKDGTVMVELCNIKNGVYPGGFALHHSQIEDKEPLSFFALHNGEVIVNPEIINHTNQKIEKEEACLSFPAELPIKVIRYHKVTVKFQTLIPKEGSELPILSEVVEQGFSGRMAEIFQHEISHQKGNNIYDEEYSSESCCDIKHII